MDKLEKWKGFIPDKEIEAYRKGAFGRRIGFGEPRGVVEYRYDPDVRRPRVPSMRRRNAGTDCGNY